MARRSGGTHKGVEEKRRSLPIYQHYTLSPGKTKSHHPEAKCNHCLKEFVCGSKQRLIRHLRKCNSISNSDQIIAETLNTLARNSATGTLNHSILEASNLLPSQINPHLQHNHQQQPHHIVSHSMNHSPSSTITTASSNVINTTSNNGNGNNLTTTQMNNSNHINHNTSGSNNDTGIFAGTSNGSQQPISQVSSAIPTRKGRRGRRPAIRVASSSGIHVTTGLDGKAHFTPASQLPPTVVQGGPSGSVLPHMHNGCPVGYTLHGPVTTAPSATSNSSNHMACATPNHHQTTYKLNSEPIDKAYLKLVLTRNLPLSLCDTKEFQLWVKTFANDYKPPSSANLVAQNLRNEAQGARQRISNILVKAPKKTINLELHCWPDKSHQRLWYALIANLEHKRFLISIIDVNGNSQNNSSLLSGDQQPDDSAGNIIPSDKILSNFIDECISRVGSDRINSLMFSETRDNDLLASRIHQALYTIHPSIITYHCWWNFTNQLCPDVEHNDRYQHVLKNRMSLSEYMNWFLSHGKTLMDAWRQSPGGSAYTLLANYLNRFHASESDFKLLLAAYLLNPSYRCAYMTQKAKDTAIEEILNIASEFMPEESDGRTIFDQWKLYLVREEPYDMVFDEGRSTPLEWWLSLPCAESIRRVALRILRLRAFTSPKTETIFSQLYYYENETRSRLNESSFEDVAILRYFYDFEDKTGQANSHTSNSQLSNTNISMSHSSNGYHERSQLGHNDQMNQTNHSNSDIDISIDSSNQLHDSMAISESRQESLSDSYSEVVEPCLTNHHTHITLQAPKVSVEDLPGYNLFIQFFDYSEPGVQIVEEPAEKKKRKWTAQEILSKCQ